MPGQTPSRSIKGRADEIAVLRLLVHEFRRVAARVRALAQLRAAGEIIARLKRDRGVTRLRPPNLPLPAQDEPFPPLPALWPPDGFLVGHWAEPDSRILRERPVHLWEDRDKLIAEREALLAERARLRRRQEVRERKRRRRGGRAGPSGLPGA